MEIVIELYLSVTLPSGGGFILIEL